MQILPVKQFDPENTRRLSQTEMRRQLFRRGLLGGDLIQLYGIPGTADLIGKAGEKAPHKAVTDDLALGQDRNAAAAFLAAVGPPEPLGVAELLSLGKNRLSCGLRHGAAAVKNLGDCIPGQSAGVRNILHRNSFQRHEIRILIFLYYYCASYHGAGRKAIFTNCKQTVFSLFDLHISKRKNTAYCQKNERENAEFIDRL